MLYVQCVCVVGVSLSCVGVRTILDGPLGSVVLASGDARAQGCRDEPQQTVVGGRTTGASHGVCAVASVQVVLGLLLLDIVTESIATIVCQAASHETRDVHAVVVFDR